MVIGRVHVVGSGDVDRVEVFLLVEQLAPVLVDLHIGESLLDLAQVSEIDVGDRDQLDVGARGERADVGGRHARGPKARVVKGFARCGGRVGRASRRERRSRRRPTVSLRCAGSREWSLMTSAWFLSWQSIDRGVFGPSFPDGVGGAGDSGGDDLIILDLRTTCCTFTRAVWNDHVPRTMIQSWRTPTDPLAAVE